MRRPWIIGSAGVVILLAAWMLVNFLRPDRLTSEGSIRRWARAAKDRDPKIRQEAEAQFKNAKDPVQVCIVLLHLQPTRWETLYANYAPKVISKFPPRIAQHVPPPTLDYRGYRRLAVERLGQLGPRSSNAVPALVVFLNDPDQFLYASVARTLGRIGPSAAPAVPALVKWIEDFHGRGLSSGPAFWWLPGAGPPPVRRSGMVTAATTRVLSYPLGVPTEEVVALGEIGVRDPAAVQTLARCLTNRSPQLQLLAAKAIWEVERDPQRLLQILPDWISAFQDPPNRPGFASQAGYRRQAVGLVAQIAEADRQALRILEGLVSDRDIPIRLSASQALYKLDGQTNTYIRVRSEVLREGNEESRWSCLEALERVPGQRDLVLPLIIGALKDESNRIRGKAAITLGKLGADAQAALPALNDALNDSHSNVREAAAEALLRLASKRGR